MQEKKRVNRAKAAIKKAAADLPATGSITDNSADQSGQVGNTLITKLLLSAGYSSAFHCHSHQLSVDLSYGNACLSCLLTCCCCEQQH